jgi:class 3 adenylate cyclase
LERYFRLKLSAEQRAIRKAFAKYLSPQMLERLTVEGFDTRLGGEKVKAAVMFTDLESFTEMCVRIRSPERIVETLNDYFQRTTTSVFEHHGIIVKYIGDAIFAAWGAPIADPDAALHAARAAWKLFQNDKLHVEGHEHRTRIGVHFGEVVAGNIGSEQRIDYTLIGDTVNLASRLEGINKMLGTYILLSGEANAFVAGEFRTRCVGDFIVKGRDEPVAVYEMLGPILGESEPAWITAYHAALAQLRSGGLDAALGQFQRVAELRGADGDGPSRFLIERIRRGEVLAGGVIRLTEK